jgi:hypothetical protein
MSETTQTAGLPLVAAAAPIVTSAENSKMANLVFTASILLIEQLCSRSLSGFEYKRQGLVAKLRQLSRAVSHQPILTLFEGEFEGEMDCSRRGCALEGS